MLGLMGKKLGMAQRFTKEGDLVPVTVVQVGPCTVVQKKVAEQDGYSALQLGFGVVAPRKLSKAECGHCEKKGVAPHRNLREFRTDRAADFEVGDVLCAGGFEAGETVHVTGITKGRGFQGVMRRHGKHGGPASHGSDFHRRPGSIGMRTWPGRVLKNTRLPGQMGTDRVTIRNLTVLEVRPEENIVMLCGSVPGANDGIVLITPEDAAFAGRAGLKRGAAAPADETPAEPQAEAAATDGSEAASADAEKKE